MKACGMLKANFWLILAADIAFSGPRVYATT